MNHYLGPRVFFLFFNRSQLSWVVGSCEEEKSSRQAGAKCKMAHIERGIDVTLITKLRILGRSYMNTKCKNFDIP